MQTDTVLVVGAGPTGLMMAGELARHGIACRIVDRHAEPSKESRAIAVQTRTIECFAAIGLGDALLERSIPIHRLRLYFEGEPGGTVETSEIDSRFNFLVSIPQAETEQILEDRLNQLGVQVERGLEATQILQLETAVSAQFSDGSEERYAYVVGCDGAHSIVRQSQGIPFEGEEYAESFGLADLDIDWEVPRDEAVVMVAPEGFLGVFPLPGGSCRIVADMELQGNDRPTPPTAEHIQRVFDERSAVPAVLGAPTWLSGFRLHRRIVNRLRQGRCFLAGDAAHLHSPAGGQGMNTGLQDSMNLAWKLALEMKGMAYPGLTDTYEWERLPVDRDVVKLSDLLMKNIQLSSETLRRIRAHVVPWLLGFAGPRRSFANRLSEVWINYQGAPLSVGPNAGNWSGLSNLPDGARHLLVGSGRDLIPERWRPYVEFRDLPGDPMVVRPDGYIGATDNFVEYFRRLELGTYADRAAATVR